MTRSSGQDYGGVSGSKGPGLILNILFCLAFILLGVVAVTWMMSDITGEYNMEVMGTRALSVSVVRKATTVEGELVPPNGAPMVLLSNTPPDGSEINWVFQTRDDAVKRGLTMRRAALRGTIKDGEIKGVLQEGNKEYQVRLKRDGISSIYRNLQSHLP